MYEFQKDLWAALSGSDSREMKIIMGGRQIGTSVMAQVWNDLRVPGYRKVAEAEVDGNQWFTVKCTEEISSWIRSQPKNMRHEHIDKNWYVYKNMFDIHEKIYTMLQLKYGDERV